MICAIAIGGYLVSVVASYLMLRLLWRLKALHWTDLDQTVGIVLALLGPCAIVAVLILLPRTWADAKDRDHNGPFRW